MDLNFLDCLSDIQTTSRSKSDVSMQARNQGGRRGAKTPLKIFSSSLEKCVGHNLKLLDII